MQGYWGKPKLSYSFMRLEAGTYAARFFCAILIAISVNFSSYTIV